MRKKRKKTRKKVKKRAARRNARGQRGGKEGCITLQKSACGGKTCEEFCKGVYAELWQASSTPRRGAADDGKRAAARLKLQVRPQGPGGVQRGFKRGC